MSASPRPCSKTSRRTSRRISSWRGSSSSYCNRRQAFNKRRWLHRPEEIRDLGDVIEIPIVEEELIKRPVVREVLRVRKQAVATADSVAADIRREDIEVVPSDDVVIHDDETDEADT